MHSFDLILTLAGGLAAALVFGYFTQRAGLSPIVGYLLAGVAVGPNTPGFVADATMAEQLAEVGVILLMFGVGLQFHVEELLAVRRVAIPGAVAQSAAATVLGALLVQGFGWSLPSGIVFGIALSVASTVVLIRVLADNNALHTQAGHIAVGWLVVEDLFTVIALVVLPIMFGAGQGDHGGGGTNLGWALLVTTLKVGALLAFAGIVGTRVIPRVLDHVAGTRSRELFTLTVLVLALGIAVGSAMVFDVSMALGAFLAGLVVGRSEYSLRAASEALPLRDAFAVLFFVSVGMLLNPAALLDNPMLLAGTLGVVMIGKPLVAFFITWLMRYPLATGLSVSVALAQIGEFSFMLSDVGRDLGLLTPEASNVLVAAAIVSIVLNPILYRAIKPIDRWTLARPGVRALFDRSRPRDAGTLRPSRVDAAHRAVVVGYGPTGRTVTRLLSENGVEPTVIDLNVTTIRELREQGTNAIYGDATHPDTLKQAGVQQADNLILTSAGMHESRETIRYAKELNPAIHVLARTQYLRDLPEIRGAGAETVVSAEGEVGMALIEIIMERLGATPDQIDHERDRVRSEFRPSPTRGPTTN
jgi:CPA2 family monovalent cation:H+ antiporter-2